MGEVVPFKPEPHDPVREEWVRLLCFLAGHPDRADGYLARGTPRPRIVAELRSLMFGRREAEGAAAHLAGLKGRAGTARHTLPLHPQPHGFRRRATKEPES